MIRRLFSALLILTFVLVRAWFPDLLLDEVSLIALVLILLGLFSPDLEALSTRIRRLRVGNIIELELPERIDRLSEQAEETAEVASQEPGRKQISPELSSDVVQRIAEASRDPRSALILVSIEIEQAILRLAERYDLAYGPGFAGNRRLLTRLAELGVVPDSVVPLFNDFWLIRNQIVHGAGFEIPPGEIYQMFDVGLTILKYLSSVAEASDS